MDTIRSIDSEVVLWLNQWAERLGPLDSVEKLIVGDYFIPVTMALFLVAMWFAGGNPHERDGRQRAVLIALLAVGFSNLVVLILNEHTFRARPFVDHELTLLFYAPTDSSFPANPAAVAFAMASGAWMGSRKVGAVILGLAVLWSLSRIFAGVFYPTDVVAGALIGVGISHLVALVFRLIEPLPTIVLRATRTLHLA